MTTPIKYRISSTATKPVSDTVKGAPLTSLEIDGNFRSIKDSIELIQSAYLPAGYSAPVDYVAGVILSSATQTVAYQGEVYAPKVAEVPFTTGGTFEVTKFVQIQSVASVDLAGGAGAGLVGFAPVGSVAATTVQAAIAELDSEKVNTANLAASSGSSLVGYIPSGTGAVTTTVQSKLRESVSVQDFMTAAQVSDVQAGTALIDVTAAVQAALNAATEGEHAKTLVFGPGIYKITAPLNIPARGYGNFRISGYAARLLASGFSDFMLKAETTTYNGNNLTIEGLVLDGNFTAKGLLINYVQEWLLSTVKVWNCHVGVQLRKTYYGEIANECMIRNCLVGLVMGESTDNDEVNTIGFGNLKINFGTAKTNFIPKNAGESDADYNARVPSIGVDMRTVMLGINFRGITCEGMDYGFFGIKYRQGLSGGNAIKTSITECYFEAIQVSPISIRQYSGFQLLTGTTITINRCWFATGTPNIVLQVGTYSVTDNSGTVNVTVLSSSGGYRLRLETDLDPRQVTLENPDAQTQYIRYLASAASANPYKYNAYGDNNPYPTEANMLGTLEDLNGRVVPSRVRGGGKSGYQNSVFGVTARPLTFAAKFGAQEELAGPVVRGYDNNYYMLTTKDGSSLLLKKVENLHRLEPAPIAYTALELYRNTSLPQGTYTCIDLSGQSVVKNSSGKFVSPTNASYIYIGTTAEAIAQPQGSSYYSPIYWNAQINRGYCWQGDYWAWGPDWFGTKTNIRAIGTAAQRPSTPAVDYMVYYATDTATYSKWENSAWGSYTPLF